jgi:hypothetical protein
MDQILKLNYTQKDLINQFPCFLDAKNLSRYLSFYECYKNTLGIAGHIAEVGVFRGAVSLMFAKLSLLYEPHALTQVHAFDWWADDSTEQYYEPYDRIQKLINLQGLQRYMLLHRMNVLEGLGPFFEKNPHLQFKLVFLDAGEYDIVSRCLKEFWPRITNGGILILDQFNHEVAPGESIAARELLPKDCVIRTFSNGWMPTAYVIKGEKV